MKIGILTFSSTIDNYGQLFQGYALQKYLQLQGHDAYLIRYRYQPAWPLLRKIIKVALVYPLVEWIMNYKNRQWLLLLAKQNERRNFETFRKQYIRESVVSYSQLKELRRHPPLADCYLAGSDQIWSFLSRKKEYSVYFLPFGPDTIRRISYAASFGMTYYPKAFRPRLKRELKRFDHISVREADGIRICEEVGYKAQQVLDPTFLLPVSVYMSFIEKFPSFSKEYAYLYILNVLTASEIEWETLGSVLQEKAWQPVLTISSGCLQAQELFDGDDYYYATPQEWLTRIFYSQLVITTSFHGVVFSLLFHKNFIFFPLKNKFSVGNNRVYDLLDKVGLSAKIIEDATSIREVIHIPVSWQSVDDRLQPLKAQSVSYLERALK